MSQVLNRGGCKCGHENVFNPWTQGDWKDFQAEASWLATPFIPWETLDHRIIHAIRHPQEVIASLASVPNMWPIYGQTLSPYGRYVEQWRWWPLPHDRDPISLAILFYINWFIACEVRCDETVQVEEINADTFRYLTQDWEGDDELIESCRGFNNRPRLFKAEQIQHPTVDYFTRKYQYEPIHQSTNG